MSHGATLAAVAEDAPKVGKQEWAEWVEGILEERDALKLQLAKLEEAHKEEHGELVRLRTRAKADDAVQKTHEIVAEAELTNLSRAAGTLVRVCRAVINSPLTSRIDVQSKLTLAMQAFEREMGSEWTGS